MLAVVLQVQSLHLGGASLRLALGAFKADECAVGRLDNLNGTGPIIRMTPGKRYLFFLRNGLIPNTSATLEEQSLNNTNVSQQSARCSTWSSPMLLSQDIPTHMYQVSSLCLAGVVGSDASSCAPS